MADINIPMNDAATEQALAVASPTRTDDQILPLSNCQLDEQWFNLHKDILRDALDITLTNDNNPFVALPSSDIVIEYVNTLGYPSTLRNVFAMFVNALYQPWRAENLATTVRGKKKTAHLLIPSVRFTKLIIHHLRTKHSIHPRTRSPLHYLHKESILNTLRFVGKDGREILGMPIPDALHTDEIKGAPYYGDYQEHVAKYQQFLDAEHGKVEEGGATESSDATKVTKPKATKVTKPASDKTPKPTATQPPKPKPTPTQPSKAVSEKRQKLVKETPNEPSPAKRSKGGLAGKRCKPKSPLKLVDEPSDKGVPVEDPAHTDEESDLQRVLELSLKEQAERTQGPARPVVLREPESGKYQPLPELPLTNSEIELDEEVPVINAGDQDEGQARPNPDEQDEGQAGPNPGEQDDGQAGSNPGDAAESQPQPSHVVYVGSNLEHMDLETTDASTQQKTEQMDKEFTTIAYLNVQENLKLLTEDQVILEEPASSTGTLSSLQNLDNDLSFTDQFFIEKPQEEEPGKTNAEAESQSDSPLPTSIVTTSTITTTTTLPPPPLQSTTDPIIVRRIGELEQHITDLIQNNLALEESKAVDEIVTDAVDCAMQAPLRARFRDLPTFDMKEIL
ncbi:retrovirus-related pol polyprotein from transposon TNT 1-94 [Tanacetum coccineum]